MSRTTPPPGRPPAPQDAPRRGIEVGLLPFVAGIVGAVLVAGVVVGTLWFTADAEAEPVETTTAATQPAGALRAAPELRIDADGELLTYSVGHDQFRQGDVFQLRRGVDEAVLEQAWPDRLGGGRTEKVTRVAPGKEECATARLVRGDQSSPWSGVKCEKGAG